MTAYETFRATIEARWLAAQHTHHLAAERLYERVLFRLVDPPREALVYLNDLVQETRDLEVCAWYTRVLHELAALPEVHG